MTGRRLCCGAVLLLTASLGLLATASPASANTDLSYAESAAAAIMNSQDLNQGPMYGAIVMKPPSYGASIDSSSDWLCVTPDRGNVAAQALAVVGAADGDAQGEFAAAQNWLNWYVAHLNWPDQYGLHGSIDDYVVNPATGQWEYSTGGGDCPGMTTTPADAYYDSSDLYAASFLTAVQAFAQADPSAGDAWVQNNSYPVEVMGSVVTATQQANGLMGAKPDYTTQYLEDNAGDYQGMEADAWLRQNVLNDSSGASSWRTQAQSLQTAIQDYLWQPCSGQDLYCVAAGATGTSWSDFGTGAINQMVAAGEQGVPAEAATLLTEFNSHYPHWTDSCDQAPGDSCLANTDSWAALAALQQGDQSQAQTWLNSAERTWGGAGWPWPWTTEDAGVLALVAAALGAPPTGPVISGVSSGLCVDDRGSSTTPGNPIQIYTCNGTGAQQWTVEPDGTLHVKGMCMDATGSGTSNGTPIDLYTCNGTGAQQWRPQANGALVNPESGKCLDDPGSSTTPGTQLQIYTCNDTGAQDWTLPN